MGAGFEQPFLEGGARLAEDCINDVPNRYMSSGRQLFVVPSQSMWDAPIADTRNTYAWGLFWKYLCEQHGTATAEADEPVIGFDAYRAVMEAVAVESAADPGIGYRYEALRNARARLPFYGTFDQFIWYEVSGQELSSNETTWGNFLVANYLHGTASPVRDRRFDYLEDDHVTRVRVSESPPLVETRALASFMSTVERADDLVISHGDSIARTVNLAPLSARYFRVTPGADSPPHLLRVTLATAAGLTDPLLQVLRLGPGRSLVDLHRSDNLAWSKTVNMEGLQEVVVILGGRRNQGPCTLLFEGVDHHSDVMVTRWNSKEGTEYEQDPHGYSWTWVSPDVMVDTDDDGRPDGAVYIGVDNLLKIRLRNRGDAHAEGISIRFWYQRATPYLSPNAWVEVRDVTGRSQVVSGETLMAGEERWFGVRWAPTDDSAGVPHYCIKAVVSVPGDANIDNKVVLSNFVNVVPNPSGDVPLYLRFAEEKTPQEIIAVPRGPRWAGVIASPPFRDDASARVCRRDDRYVLPEAAIVIATVMQLEERQAKCWNDRVVHSHLHKNVYYPTDLRTLPPGVDPNTLVTVVHRLDGHPVGGVTYQIRGKRTEVEGTQSVTPGRMLDQP